VGNAVLLYDGDCGFCRWALAKILRLDRRKQLRPVRLQDPEAQRLLVGLDPARRFESWHLVVGDRVYSAGAAVPPLLDLLPHGAAFAALSRRLPRITEWTYSAVARNRSRLGRRLSAEADPSPR
jgi:predicted DCC family thiol-disulfide oxidoreductase YuxK